MGRRCETRHESDNENAFDRLILAEECNLADHRMEVTSVLIVDEESIAVRVDFTGSC